MKRILPIGLVLLISIACNDKKYSSGPLTIAKGQMPNLAIDASGFIHVVYGSGDSLMYTYSMDHGSTFAPVSMIAFVPKLTASHTRGPQIAATGNGLVVIACNEPGDI